MWLCYGLWIGILIGLAVPVSAQDSPALATQVKAAFLAKFPSFVGWPSESFPTRYTPIMIGLLGKDPFGDDFDQAIRGLQSNGRPLTVKRFKDLEDLESCHVLFISNFEERRWREIFDRLKTVPVLTVGDSSSFTRQGGMLNFIQQEGKVRFEINLEAVKRAGLTISAKMLQVSKLVQEGS